MLLGDPWAPPGHLPPPAPAAVGPRLSLPPQPSLPPPRQVTKLCLPRTPTAAMGHPDPASILRGVRGEGEMEAKARGRWRRGGGRGGG